MTKIRTSFSLSQEALDLLKLLAIKMGRSKANTLEVIIKEAAKSNKIKLQ